MFSLAAFRARYPQFAGLEDGQIHACADQAGELLSVNGGTGDSSRLCLLVAHLLTLEQQAKAGAIVGQVTGAGVDKINVSLAAAPSRDMWEYWLSLTPFGLQLLVLLKVCSAGGLYVGGRPERAAFRSVGGKFPGGGRSWRR